MLLSLWGINFKTSYVFMLMGVHDCFIDPSLWSTKKVHNKMDVVVVVGDNFLHTVIYISITKSPLKLKLNKRTHLYDNFRRSSKGF